MSDLRDTDRAAVYATESMILRFFDEVGSTRCAVICGMSITLPVEARFASLSSIDDYLRRVLAMPAVVNEFPRAGVPVRVRPRKGTAAATYEREASADPTSGVIAIPIDILGSRWALRELVVLHELAHHLDGSADPPHGRSFRITLASLVSMVIGPEVGLCYRIMFWENGL